MSLLSMHRGDQRAFTITLTDDDTGAALDLTGLTITFTAKRRPTDLDAAAVITKSTADGIVVSAPTSGIAVLTIESADTEDLTDLRSLYWDIQVDNLAGDVRTPLTGLLAITTDITQTSGAS